MRGKKAWEANMPQDAFTLRLVSRELHETLKGGKINRVNQPGKEELSLLIYTGKRTLKLILNANASDCGAYFCEEDAGNPQNAPAFCMLLRKHIQGADILGVDTPGFERILRFRLLCHSEFRETERFLIAEIMGKYSNIILLENGVILGALKTTSLDENTKRMIFAGVKYVPPFAQDKTDPSDETALRALLENCTGDVGDFLFRNVRGLAPVTAQAIAASYRGGDLAEHVHDFIFSDEISPRVIERDGAAVDFTARGNSGIPFPTLSEAQSEFYRRKREKKQFDGLKRRLLSALQSARNKQEKQLRQNLEKQLSCRNAEENRIKGELLTANLYALHKGMQGCEVENYYTGQREKISLDPQLSPAENAQAYYKKYRKQKRTVEVLVPRERETRAEMTYLESLCALAESALDVTDLNSIAEEMTAAGLIEAPKEKKKTGRAEIPFRTYECGGMRVLAGRNNLQNDALIRQSAPEDIWLHAQRYHSCHVVIKSEGKAVPDDVLSFAAGVCALYSDAHGEKIPVDYCLLKFVKKPPHSKAGFVIYSNFKTTLGDPNLIKN